MEDGAIVAVVAIIFGFLYSVARMYRPTGGRARVAEDQDDGSKHSQRELFDLAMRLQNRVETLERVLDGTQPEWRGKP